MIETIAAGLERVVGGSLPNPAAPNRTTIVTKDSNIHSERTDYGYCVDTVKKACTVANRGWFGTHRSLAAQCVLDELSKSCPPTMAGGPTSAR